MANETEARSLNQTWVWAVLAGIVVLAFMTWLTLTSEPSVIASVQEEVAADASIPATPTVTAQQFEDQMGTYNGREIELEDVVVVSRSGAEILWVELPSGALFAVKAEPVVGEGFMPQSRVSIVGRVQEKTAAVLDAWQEAGVIQDAGQAGSGSHYIEASAIRPATDEL